jgi:PIN domain nuclease of toxin-antitoxin system
VRLLLDTHVAIWALSLPHHLPPDISAILSDETNEIFVSVVGIWEVAIKGSLKRSSSPKIDAALLAELCDEAGFEILPVTVAHALAVLSLPKLHADPFDRMMVAQAKIEPMRLVTHDRVVASYDDAFISW